MPLKLSHLQAVGLGEVFKIMLSDSSESQNSFRQQKVLLVLDGLNLAQNVFKRYLNRR